MSAEEHPDGGAAEAARSLDATYTAHRAAALALARRILGDDALAEDAVQRAFLQILVRVQGGDGDLLAANPRAAVLRGTRWAALKLADRRQALRVAEARAAAAAAEDGGAAWAGVEARLLVEEILPELPQSYRDVLRLRFFEARADAAGASALSVTLKAYRRRLDRALEAARQTAERRGVDSVGVLLPQLPTGVRSWLRETATRLDAGVRRARLRSPRADAGGWSNLGHVAMALAVVGLAAGSGGAAAPGHGGTGRGSWSETRLAAMPAAGRSHPTAVNGSAAVVAHQAALGAGGPAPEPLPRPSSGLLPDPTAGTAPPEQTTLFQVTTAPQYEQTHALLAVADGYACQCWIIYQSLDGGATWRSAPLAATTGTIVPTLELPPDYPRDPRVFEGFDASDSGVDCVLATFDAATCMPIPVSGPLRLDAAFDDGFPVVYASEARVGVVAYDLGSHATHVLMVSTGILPQPIAVPSAIGPVALYMRGPDTDVVALADGRRDSGNDVFACDRSFRCTVRNPADTGFFVLQTDRLDATGKLVLSSTASFQTDTALLSSDGGGTFTPERLDKQFVSQWALVGPAANPLVVATVEPPAVPAPWSLWWKAADETGWHAMHMPPVGDFEVITSVITEDRIIISEANGAGFWCTADRGATWAHRCPAA